jgi:hypothetical protein
VEEVAHQSGAGFAVVDDYEAGGLPLEEWIEPVSVRGPIEEAGVPPLMAEAPAPLDEEASLAGAARAVDEEDAGEVGRVAPLREPVDLLLAALPLERDDLVARRDELAGRVVRRESVSARGEQDAEVLLVLEYLAQRQALIAGPVQEVVPGEP